MRNDVQPVPIVVTEPCGCYTSTQDGIVDHYLCRAHWPTSTRGMPPMLDEAPRYAGSLRLTPVEEKER